MRLVLGITSAYCSIPCGIALAIHLNSIHGLLLTPAMIAAGFALAWRHL